MSKPDHLQFLDATNQAVGGLRHFGRPEKGWLRLIRMTLHLGTEEVANTLKICKQGVSKYERSEAERKITLSTLDKAADAMGCEVVYFLVPKQDVAKSFLELGEVIQARKNKGL